jgi:hypothetical protein
MSYGLWKAVTNFATTAIQHVLISATHYSSLLPCRQQLHVLRTVESRHQLCHHSNTACADQRFALFFLVALQAATTCPTRCGKP